MLLYRKISLTFCPDVPRNLQGRGSADCGLGDQGGELSLPPHPQRLSQRPGGLVGVPKPTLQGRLDASCSTAPPRLTLSPDLTPSLPYSINGGLVWVGDQLECGVCSGQWEHAGMQGLLRQRIVGWIEFAWHHIHRYRGLEGTRQGELIGLKKPTSYSRHPTSPSPSNSSFPLWTSTAQPALRLLTLSCRRISSSILTASTLAAWVFLVRYLAWEKRPRIWSGPQ